MPTIDNLQNSGDTTYFGDPAGVSYVAQTFVAEGNSIDSVSFLIDGGGAGFDVPYHFLITEVEENGNGFHPGRVLKEVTGLVEPADLSTALEQVTVALDGLRLEKGKTYAIVFDAFTPTDYSLYGASLGTNTGYSDGYAASLQRLVYEGRPEDFDADWTEHGFDLAFSATFSEAGKTVNGTKKDDKLKGTSKDDTINGKKGDDKLKAKDGYDTLIGGKNDDILKGGGDGDVLIGGKHKDKLYGLGGHDCYVFDFKMTKNSAKKHWDKIYGFETEKDEIHLKQKYFSDLASGALPDSDTHVTYKKNALFYNDVKFVKFKGSAPSSLDDIDIVVVA